MISYIDIIIAIPLLFSLYRGWKNGFVMEIFSLLSLFVGVYLGIHLSDWVSVYLRDEMHIESDNLPIISFVLILALVIVGLYFLGKLITKSIKAGGAEKWNQIAGACFSLVKFILSLSLLFVIFNSVDEKVSVLPQEQKDKSFFYKPIYNFSLKVLPSLKESEFYKAVTTSTEEVIQQP